MVAPGRASGARGGKSDKGDTTSATLPRSDNVLHTIF